MDWQNVLKRKIETLADYTNASPEERRRYHVNRRSVYARRLKALRNSIANVGETNPNIPLEEDMRELQEIRNFHARQADRIRLGGRFPDVFSPELEQQKQDQKLTTTPRGILNPYIDLSMEEYEKLTKKQKSNYHQRRGFSTSGEEKTFHGRMYARLKSNSTLPTFPTPDLGGETTVVFGIKNTKEEYDNMSREDKMRYHRRAETRFKRENNLELKRFHQNMYARLRRNSQLPVFYSPEHQEEE